MIRVFNLFVPAGAFILLITDLVLFEGLLLAALALGYGTLAPATEPQAADLLLPTVVFLTVLCATGLYERRFLGDVRQMAVRAFTGAVLTLAALLALALIRPQAWESAPEVAAAVLGSALGAMLLRHAYMRLSRLEALRGRVVVVGGAEGVGQIAGIAATRATPRFCLTGFVPLDGTTAAGVPTVPETTLLEFCRTARVTEVVVAPDPAGPEPRQNLLVGLREAGIRVLDRATFLEREAKQIDVAMPCPHWALYSSGSAGEGVAAAAKRVLDLVAASLLLLLTLPLMLITAAAIRLEDGGPVFYRQERVGRHGRSFMLIKFRSMRVDAEKDGVARWAVSRDPRITLIGSLIRPIRVDEIPQVLNVLRGEMSFVGPRPERPAIVAELEQRMPAYAWRHIVKPGITGWAQVNYPYGASFEDSREKLKYDLYYVKNRSLMMDLLIILQTVRVVLFSEGGR
ncbi:TIGR03013 family XrtA/PEP-CTERM system glycosyltransferase [Rhodocista pekingensis]|uniref:TIGR03013 family XrtA/PEP-CTERM system glycosyltransferase n=1 Tax=Rhodocista pekingensis TaxID=201185 RepID=A0ABW2L0W7_9PROT